MFCIIQYTLNRYQMGPIRMHGYFADYTKAVAYTKAKALATLSNPNDIYILRVNGGLDYVDKSVCLQIQNEMSTSTIIESFHCVAYLKQLSDSRYKEFVQDVLVPDEITLKEFLQSLPNQTAADPANFYMYATDTALKEELVKNIIAENYTNDDDLTPYNIHDHISNDIFMIVELQEIK
jgi:hypothetical protein